MAIQTPHNLVIVKRAGIMTLARDKDVPDYTLWLWNRIITCGSFELCDARFKQLEAACR